MRSATVDDIPAVAAVATACDLADIGERNIFEDWVHDEWLRSRFDPSSDAWVVTAPGGEVVAGTYTWEEDPQTLFDTSGWVHPEHRGRGLGTALVLAVEGRAVRDAPELRAGSAPRVQQSGGSSSCGGATTPRSG